MGALIQTKGTRFLANFFNSRFSVANMPTMRAFSGGSLVNDFAYGSSLLDISDKYVGQWAADHSDILYPTATVSTVNAAVAGSTTLTFTSALPGFAVNGMAIADQSTPKAIQKGTTITINSTTQVTLSLPLSQPVVAGDAIVFSDPNHPNLGKRWRHYLKNDLISDSHSAIQSAIFDALSDPSVTYISFQAIESDSQKVLSAIEYELTGGHIDKTKKFKQVVLLTPRTTAPDIDNQ
jgi:hypothetical protein